VLGVASPSSAQSLSNNVFGATGARRLHVLMQFLIEAMLLSAMGGGAGILAGIAASEIISSAAGGGMHRFPLPPPKHLSSRKPRCRTWA
jgi:hypothetical protein